jgi:beta-glucosidase/6-phospho-beta-glucosidase/beta-galactosidase
MRPDFFWGVATSAFQLEGCVHADWALWDPVLQSKPDVKAVFLRVEFNHWDQPIDSRRPPLCILEVA